MIKRFNRITIKLNSRYNRVIRKNKFLKKRFINQRRKLLLNKIII
jgi:hypothetical protein